MSKYRNSLYYLVAVVLFSVFIYLIVHNGKNMELGREIPLPDGHTKGVYAQIRELVEHNITHPLAILLLQIITIIFCARTFGFIFSRIGLPSVVGEIFAGLFLGPSFMGNWFPNFNTFLFPLESLGNLQFLSQVGLVLFMFVIGMELDLKVLKNRVNEALIISHTGIFISFSLGVYLAYSLYETFTPENVPFISFALFMGTALSVTAFPVLARIIHERNLTKTKLGTMAITSAAIDDITAWCILATVIAIVKAGDVTSSFFTISLAITFVIAMIKIVQPFLKKLGEVYSHREAMSLNIVAAIFGILLISAFLAEIIGIHALFGAFLAGVIMPPSVNFRKILIERTESVSLGLLLPLFFVFTGLRTQITLLNQEHMWKTTFYIISLAVVGKLAGATIASRFLGQSWKNSLSLGALMNTRGLMELVVLNIGYDLGILSPEIFSMMVVMALVTTLMTGPLLDLINLLFRKHKETEEQDHSTRSNFRILLSFASATGGRKLLRLVNILTGYTKNSTEITALHVTPNTDINQYQLDEYEKESFKPIKQESTKLNLPIKTLYKVNNNVNDTILEDTNSGNYDILLIGAGQSLFSGTLLGKVIGLTSAALQPEKLISSLIGKGSLFRGKSFLDAKNSEFITQSKIPVGVFIDNKLEAIDNIIIIITSVSDVFLFFYAKKIVRNSIVSITILDYNGIIEGNFDLREEVKALNELGAGNVKLVSKSNHHTVSLNDFQLLISSLDGYEVYSNSFTETEIKALSMLLIRP